MRRAAASITLELRAKIRVVAARRETDERGTAIKRLLFVALIVASNANSAGCTRIEYVEARDWSLEQLERAYCADLQTGYQNFLSAMDLEKKRKHQAADAAFQAGQGCRANVDLFLRVRENIHKRNDTPDCPPIASRRPPA